jgi:hypothetical protein
VEQEHARGYLSIRQLSLLRKRMKAGLNVFRLSYHVDLDEDDAVPLRSCGENPAAMSWASLRCRAAPQAGGRCASSRNMGPNIGASDHRSA